ncbi:hypothetical protein BU14_0694s0006 [Porphyra umbilicalis]|uniref:Uncharacterized protein n=1 Tax=Porphyra umbilicalis TaxID=2786 RepID=A0A1X6NQ89_PORUM|nr:hypothetical protein BU14_0694s0006 [Porphyra umbilicalis]|eukprot:OSX70666.1 hypothetical protein BU14_0694s0006 [Porphyra umbilicalis]
MCSPFRSQPPVLSPLSGLIPPLYSPLPLRPSPSAVVLLSRSLTSLFTSACTGLLPLPRSPATPPHPFVDDHGPHAALPVARSTRAGEPARALPRRRRPVDRRRHAVGRVARRGGAPDALPCRRDARAGGGLLARRLPVAARRGGPQLYDAPRLQRHRRTRRQFGHGVSAIARRRGSRPPALRRRRARRRVRVQGVWGATRRPPWLGH